MHKRSFFAGMLVMALIVGLTGTAVAATASRQVTVDYNNIKITLDGEPVVPKNAQGTTVEPFLINGTTYLPLRAVASALDLSVSWDAKTNTAILTSSGAGGFPECYPDFSVPTLDNIVGFEAYEDLYVLDSGDSIAYYYDLSKFPTSLESALLDYMDLLTDYGFQYLDKPDEEIYFDNEVSGVTVVLTLSEDSRSLMVLVMAMPEDARADMLSDARRF